MLGSIVCFLRIYPGFQDKCQKSSDGLSHPLQKLHIDWFVELEVIRASRLVMEVQVKNTNIIKYEPQQNDYKICKPISSHPLCLGNFNNLSRPHFGMWFSMGNLPKNGQSVSIIVLLIYITLWRLIVSWCKSCPSCPPQKRGLKLSGGMLLHPRVGWVGGDQGGRQSYLLYMCI